MLLALTGIGPLIAWRRASAKNLRRQFAAPVFAGATVGAALFTLGMRDFSSLVCYTLAGFVTGTIVQEFAKGIVARRTIHGEIMPVAAIHLVSRNRRRYGGYIVHFGIVVMFSALAGNAFKQEHDVTLAAGQTFSTRDPYGHNWTFTSQGVSSFEQLNRNVQAVALRPTRDGVVQPIVRSEKRQYRNSLGENSFEPATEVGIFETARQDVYVVLAGASADNKAEMRISFNPLVMWCWWGGIIMALGGLIVMWPQAERARRESGYVAELAPEAIGAGA